MPDEELLAAAFEGERARLRSVAYRVLGSADDADDAVQETWLRVRRTDGIENLGGWLTTVVSRVCLDMLRSRRREDGYAEVEPIVSTDEEGHPEFEAELADSVGSAMLVVLQTLPPAERLAFVLHDMFAVPFEEIATVIGRSPAATRQLASRGRRRIQRPEEPPGAGDTEVVDAFLKASREGDFERLLSLLDPDAAVLGDEAAKQMGTQGFVTGGEEVARFFTGRARAVRPAEIDGTPGAAWVHAKETKVVFAFTVVDGKILEIELLADSGVISPARVTLVSRRDRSL